MAWKSSLPPPVRLESTGLEAGCSLSTSVSVILVLSFLIPYGIKFEDVFVDIGGKSNTTLFLTLAFIIILLFQNTNILAKKFKSTQLSLIFTILLFGIAISLSSRTSEFLYFNF